MTKILIFGNSGSGKSTLARKICDQRGLAHLDLDVLAWLPTTPPRRMPLSKSALEIARFTDEHDAWVIEGCYVDLLQLAAASADEIIFMNLSIDDCLSNARLRPWEPHKYPSKQAQDANLEMLLDWIRQYQDREDEFSYSAHSEFYESFTGSKQMHVGNQ